MLVVDSGVWIDFFNGTPTPAGATLRRLLACLLRGGVPTHQHRPAMHGLADDGVVIVGPHAVADVLGAAPHDGGRVDDRRGHVVVALQPVVEVHHQ